MLLVIGIPSGFTRCSISLKGLLVQFKKPHLSYGVSAPSHESLLPVRLFSFKNIAFDIGMVMRSPFGTPPLPKPPDLILMEAGESLQPPQPPAPPKPPDPVNSSCRSHDLYLIARMNLWRCITSSCLCDWLLPHILQDGDFLNCHGFYYRATLAKKKDLGKLNIWIGKPLFHVPLVDNPRLVVEMNYVMVMIQPGYCTNRVFLARLRYVLIGTAHMIGIITRLVLMAFAYHTRCVFTLPRIEGFTTDSLHSCLETSFAIVRFLCRLCYVVLSAMKFFSFSLWQVKRNEIINAISLVHLDCYCLVFSGDENLFITQKKHTFLQGSSSYKSVYSGLVGEVLALKAAIYAARTAEFKDFYIVSDSQTLVTLLNSEKEVNELNSITYDLRCLMRSYSLSIDFSYVSRKENVIADTLAKETLNLM